MTQTPMSSDDRRAVEEFCQVLRWLGTPLHPSPYALIADDWYSGILTIEEGQRIEAGRQVWQPYEFVEVR